MSRPKAIFLVAGVIMLGLVLTAWAFLNAQPPVTLTVLSCTTNRLPDDIAKELGHSTYVQAVIAVTNKSNKTFTYDAEGSPTHAEYGVLQETKTGWKGTGDFACGMGIEEHSLRPGQGFIFLATLDPGQRYKVEFFYSDGRKPNPAWKRLPRWLSRRLPWASSWRSVTTEPIDLRPQRT